MARPCCCRTRPSPCGLSLSRLARSGNRSRSPSTSSWKSPAVLRTTHGLRTQMQIWMDSCVLRTGAGARRVAVSRARPPPGWWVRVTALQPAGIERNGSSRQRLYNVLLLLRYGRGTVLEEILRIVFALWAWWRVPSPLAPCQAEPHMRRPRTAVRTVYGLRDTPRNYDRKKKGWREIGIHPCICTKATVEGVI
jgi:hypothetical protein